MKLDHIEVKNFRNIASASLELCPGSCVLVGKNAQGKTNLMEAIYRMACGKSFRVKGYRDLIRHGESLASVTVSVSGEGLPFQLRMMLDEKNGNCTNRGIFEKTARNFSGAFRDYRRAGRVCR